MRELREAQEKFNQDEARLKAGENPDHYTAQEIRDFSAVDTSGAPNPAPATGQTTAPVIGQITTPVKTKATTASAKGQTATMPAIGQADHSAKIPQDPDFLEKVNELCKERGHVV